MIIPTIGRVTLDRAVLSVLEQDLPVAKTEVIVVNDFGQPLPVDNRPWSTRVKMIHTQRRERCVARNTGAAVAAGEYLYFLDDDDWLLPGAMSALWDLAARAPEAVWLYGGIRVVDESGIPIAEENSILTGNCLAKIMGGAWAPIQSSCISASAFFSVGGFDTEIRGTEDLDLCRRLAALGDFANTTSILSCLSRGRDWKTSTDYDRAPEDTRRSRDRVVDQPGTFRRITESADSAYWWGRTLRVYMSLALWNLRRGALFVAWNRALFALTAWMSTGRYLLDRKLWRALKDHHAPGSLHFVERRLNRKEARE